MERKKEINTKRPNFVKLKSSESQRNNGPL